MDKGKIIKRLRGQKDLTHKQVAEHLGVGQSLISMYEKGKADPPTEKLEKLAALFEVPVSVFFELEQKVNEKSTSEKIIEELIWQNKKLIELLDKALSGPKFSRG